MKGNTSESNESHGRKREELRRGEGNMRKNKLIMHKMRRVRIHSQVILEMTNRNQWGSI